MICRDCGRLEPVLGVKSSRPEKWWCPVAVDDVDPDGECACERRRKLLDASEGGVRNA